MSPPPAAAALAMDEPDEALDPALLRVLEALARAHVEEDFAATQGARSRTTD